MTGQEALDLANGIHLIGTRVHRPHKLLHERQRHMGGHGELVDGEDGGNGGCVPGA